MPLSTLETNQVQGSELESQIQGYGEKIFALIDAAESPSLFSKKGFYGTLMDWTMRDEHFKTQLFRFVDVLPMLTSSSEIGRHLKEYLGDEQVNLSPALRLGLKAADGASWLFGAGIKAQVTGMARQFMLGNDDKEIVATLRKSHEQGIAFTVDILGEAVVSEAEADQYAQRYLDLMDLLGREIARWPHPCKSNDSPRGHLPPLNVSVKISALSSQIQPADPDTAIESISTRLRPILQRANELGAFINFDMESYVLKDLTLRLFQSIFAEQQFSATPACGVAMQAYLKDCETDLDEIINWARAKRRRITVRLVKGAYWDYETVIAQQQHWPVPVFANKAETDANFEKLSLMLLENENVVDAAFGTHNVRSIAHVLAQAERLGIERRNFEFQMLYGMAEPIKNAVLQLDCRLREYCPVGELLPGMAYLVRRLLENTSNEGFLANKFAKGASREELLPNPHSSVAADARTLIPTRGSETGKGAFHHVPSISSQGKREYGDAVERVPTRFQNEPHTDFTIAGERKKIQEAIRNVRKKLGVRHPLVIRNKRVSTENWQPSLNPANQNEVIGLSAQAAIAEAEAAVAAAREAQPQWGRTPPAERAAILESVANLMRRDKPELSA